MGQKTNPNIFRLGINKKWKTEFFEKKRHELPLYTFKDLEIKGYIERFLESQGLFLHDYKQHYSNATLNLYISYVVSADFDVKKRDKLDKITLVTEAGKRKISSSAKKIIMQDTLNHNLLFKNYTPLDLYRIKKYLNIQSASVTNTNFHPSTFNSETKKTELQVDGVLSNLFKVLNSFTNNKFNIIITFCCVNKNSSFLKRTQKKNFILLQKFKGTPFLKEGIELLFHVVHNKSSSNLLAKFIGVQIKKVKRHKFFFSFLKQVLLVLSSSQFSVVRGFKIMIKGRLNGVPRAKHKMITIGDVPVQSINAITDYSQISVHNSSGSYGIKVWIIEK